MAKSTATTASSSRKKKMEAELIEGNPLYGFLMSTCIFLMLAVIVLFAWDFYQRTHKPIPRYFDVQDGSIETIPDGSLYPPVQLKGKPDLMISLGMPNLTTNAVLHWAQNAATMALTFNFNNYAQVLEEARDYFTPAGYDNFINAMNSARLLQD